jgi:hypothetical protein
MDAGKSLAIGMGVPYVTKTIGEAAGAALASGASTGSALSGGVNSLTNKVSAGLLGGSSGSAATNAALKTMGTSGGKAVYGPATSSAVSKASSGANIGGAVGSGIGTAAVTLLTGGSPKEAAKSGVGSAVGTYAGQAIGSAFGPVGSAVGGFIGGTIGSIVCFEKDTPIIMADGSTKPIHEIRLDDEVYAGGRVTARGEAYAEGCYLYKKTILTGSHAVFEDGKWVRVEDSDLADQTMIAPVIVCPIETEHRLIVTPWFVSADFTEIQSDTWDYDEAERLEILNANTERNLNLLKIEAEICLGE